MEVYDKRQPQKKAFSFKELKNFALSSPRTVVIL